MRTIKDKILHRIYGYGKGHCFTPSVFFDLAANTTVNKVLAILNDEGKIRRLAFGIYEFPVEHKVLGIVPPNLNKVAKAIAQNYKIKIQPSGAYAANLMGLSEDVPAKVVFLTNGQAKKFKIGERELIFKSTTPKNMLTAGKISGLLFQALKYIGNGKVTKKMLEHLQSSLSKENLVVLKADAFLAPAWITKIIIKDILNEALH